MGPGRVVWGKKTEYKKSHETVPLSSSAGPTRWVKTKLFGDFSAQGPRDWVKMQND